MKNRIVRAVFAACTLFLLSWVSNAGAQFVPGQVLTAGQLNLAFQGVLPVTGGSLTGPISGTTATFTSANITNANVGAATISSGTASLNSLSVGSAPSFSQPLSFASGGTGASTATGATAALQYLPSFTGASARSLASKLADRVSVCDFPSACAGTGADVSASFQAAIAALPASGGTIDVPDGAYVLNTTPTWGSRSVYWNISANATFSGNGVGAGKFPYMSTNGQQLAVGPWIQSQSVQTSTGTNGGIGAFNIEMLQPPTYVGQSVGLYAGASGSNSNTAANVWAANTLVKAYAGAGGTYQNLEADVDNYSATALVKGISINGVGTYNPTVALEIIRSDATRWKMGIHVLDAITGILIDNTSGLTNGIIVNGGPVPSGTLFAGTQLANGNDSILLQRASDSSSAGYFLRCVNAANSANLCLLDVNGNAQFSSISTTGTGALPVYAASGASMNSPHMVTGSATMSSGTVTVSFAGVSAFTSSISYTCTANDTTSANAVKVSQGSGTSVTFSGTGTDTVQFICTGN